MRVVCATDVAFHDCNLWTIESNVERRVKWRAAIQKLMDFDPRVVIPGHHDEEKRRILEEVPDDPSRTYTDCVDWSLSYMDIYEEAYSECQERRRVGRGREQVLRRREGGRLQHPVADEAALPAHRPVVAHAATRPARQDLPESQRRLRRRSAQGVTAASGRPRKPAANRAGRPRRRQSARSRSARSLLAKPMIMSTGGHPHGSGMTLESHT